MPSVICSVIIGRGAATSDRSAACGGDIAAARLASRRRRGVAGWRARPGRAARRNNTARLTVMVSSRSPSSARRNADIGRRAAAGSSALLGTHRPPVHQSQPLGAAPDPTRPRLTGCNAPRSAECCPGNATPLCRRPTGDATARRGRGATRLPRAKTSATELCAAGRLAVAAGHDIAT